MAKVFTKPRLASLEGELADFLSRCSPSMDERAAAVLLMQGIARRVDAADAAGRTL